MSRRIVGQGEKRQTAKALAFIIGLFIVAVGAVGILAPSGLVWLAHRLANPAQLYVIAAFRIAFGLLLLSVAPVSRAPRALRVFAVLPLVAGIATPFIGVERAPALIEWWSQHGSGLVRLTGVLLVTLGGFFAYACVPASRAG